jgi:hypothetical protein
MKALNSADIAAASWKALTANLKPNSSSIPLTWHSLQVRAIGDARQDKQSITGDTTMENVTINTEQRLFVIEQSHGYSCLGFDVCFDITKRLAIELNKPVPVPPAENELMALYGYYTELQEIARKKNAETGWRSSAWLNPSLIGLEGRRVEVSDGGKPYRFNVGKSTGSMPIHLEIKTKRSTGGCGVTYKPFKSVKVIK